MYLKVQCYRKEVEEVIGLYEQNGFSLRNKMLNGDEATLYFDAPSTEVLASGVYGDSKGFIEFQDGTISPLYVRRNLWED